MKAKGLISGQAPRVNALFPGELSEGQCGQGEEVWSADRSTDEP